MVGLDSLFVKGGGGTIGVGYGDLRPALFGFRLLCWGAGGMVKAA